MSEPVQVLVAEKSRSLSGLLVGILEEANYSVAVAATEEEALQVAEERRPLVVLSSVSRFNGEHLCRMLRKRFADLPIALLYPPSRADDVEARARMFGADLVLLGPVQKASLLSAMRLLIRMHRLTSRLRDAENPGRLESDDAGPEPLDLPTFKRMLNLEVRKSRRYRFPAAFLLVQLDAEPLKARKLDRRAHAALVGSALATLTRGLRDIDLCVHTGSDRFIVFLPHTANEGAQVVAARLHARVHALGEPPVACSIGVAGYDGEGAVSFGSLLRDATLALKRARTEGGDRVELSGSRKRERVFIA
ncbi:MAG: diguanylate cyclase [Deltaproteobacteria bacterium]|nr:diguanylate cyclase [Deltaproteobacteria bacterium]